MAELRVLVVDDEPLVREGIRVWLEREVDLRLLGEARNGKEAVERIRELRPDLVLLDVHMPGMDGLAVVAALAPEERPAFVFVTAHSEYAIRAFDMRGGLSAQAIRRRTLGHGAAPRARAWRRGKWIGWKSCWGRSGPRLPTPNGCC